MFEKAKLTKQIKGIQKEILALEQKRSRSQAALVTAILTHTTPSDDDVDFFNKYTALIEEQRTIMHGKQEELKALDGTKTGK